MRKAKKGEKQRERVNARRFNAQSDLLGTWSFMDTFPILGAANQEVHQLNIELDAKHPKLAKDRMVERIEDWMKKGIVVGEVEDLNRLHLIALIDDVMSLACAYAHEFATGVPLPDFTKKCSAEIAKREEKLQVVRILRGKRPGKWTEAA